ncbi:putative integral membrane protein [Babesia bovis T2Bo]|uniref:Uncharacterized protein n=1 Tax=Babesia bovis TaxID=5865 RepID=A7AUS4_BABBO|nr:putative integral membrane protein [Babesia bovis T2Bo]EDO06685.1 putative integral membrane protein [Babesia bovis T2Bo]|eukprot:XP_001610253.1 hypothetical protein [Babesia bovis T2Bo]
MATYNDIESNTTASSMETEEEAFAKVYDPYYDGPRTTLLRKCAYCTTPLKYYINNVTGLEASFLILLMLCAPLGASLLSQVYSQYKPENPLHVVNLPIIWLVYYILGCKTGCLLVFGQAMRILLLVDQTIWRRYYQRKARNAEINAAITRERNNNLMLSNNATNQTNGANDEKKPDFRGDMLRLVFKFRTNTVMVNGELPNKTMGQWIKSATIPEWICHIFFPLRWLAVSILLATFHTFNLVYLILHWKWDILRSAYNVRAVHFANGLSHVTMIYVGWRVAIYLAELWRRSLNSNLNPRFKDEFHHLPNGRELISEPMFAFIMDKCPCTYEVPTLMAPRPEYELSTHFHSKFHHFAKTLFACVVFYVVTTSAAISLWAGIRLAFFEPKDMYARMKELMQSYKKLGKELKLES